jgi:hypothetical protein
MVVENRGAEEQDPAAIGLSHWVVVDCCAHGQIHSACNFVDGEYQWADGHHLDAIGRCRRTFLPVVVVHSVVSGTNVD